MIMILMTCALLILADLMLAMMGVGPLVGNREFSPCL